MTEFNSRVALFSAKGIGKTYVPGLMQRLGGAKPVIALSDVSFEIGAGEAVALVGPSGCGKTTLARIVAGLDSSNIGAMRLENAKYGGARHLPAKLRRDVSLVFQDPFGSFDPRMSVGQSVGEPLRLLPHLNPVQRQERIVEALHSVGLGPEMLRRYPHEFSGGQRQRLAIARALIARPRLVILDEPVSALDVSIQADILALFNRLRAENGLAYLMISHDLEMVRAVADRVLVMEAGRIVETGTPEAIFRSPQHQLTRDLIAARLPMPAQGQILKD